MKIKELIRELSLHDPETEIILSGDAEGNNFSPLANFSFGIYEDESENSWRGHFYSFEFSAEEHMLPEDVWESLLETKPKAIVLWPVN